MYQSAILNKYRFKCKTKTKCKYVWIDREHGYEKTQMNIPLIEAALKADIYKFLFLHSLNFFQQAWVSFQLKEKKKKGQKKNL